MARALLVHATSLPYAKNIRGCDVISDYNYLDWFYTWKKYSSQFDSYLDISGQTHVKFHHTVEPGEGVKRELSEASYDGSLALYGDD